MSVLPVQIIQTAKLRYLGNTAPMNLTVYYFFNLSGVKNWREILKNRPKNRNFAGR